MPMLVQPRPKPPVPQQMQPEQPAAPFVWGEGGVAMTPADVARKRAIAEQMVQEGTSYAPVQHWTQGLARVANALAGGLEERRAGRAEKEGRESANTALQQFLSDDAGDPKVKLRNALVLAQNPWLAESARSVVMQQAMPKEPELTGTQREFQAAKAEGFPGSFMDYQMQLSMARGGLVPNAQQPGAFTPVPGGPADPSMKPPPASVQKAEDEDIDAINASASMNNTIADITKRIEGGKLGLGFFTNLANQGRNIAGMSTPESVEYATFTQNLKKMQNDILMLHNGVQTEGDAMRALQQIVTNPTDNEVVKANLAELKRLNDIALTQRRQKIDLRRDRNRLAPLDPAAIGLSDPAAAPAPGTPPPALSDPLPTVPTDGGVPAPASALPAPVSAPTPRAIEFLRSNPGAAQDFDAKYGPGSAAKVLGGQGSPEMAAPPMPDPYQLQDLTNQRQEMNTRHRRMLTRGQ